MFSRSCLEESDDLKRLAASALQDLLELELYAADYAEPAIDPKREGLKARGAPAGVEPATSSAVCSQVPT